jgi:hypothetical protein
MPLSPVYIESTKEKSVFSGKISGFAAVLGLFLTVFGMVESAGKSSFLVG